MRPADARKPLDPRVHGDFSEVPFRKEYEALKMDEASLRDMAERDSAHLRKLTNTVRRQQHALHKAFRRIKKLEEEADDGGLPIPDGQGGGAL